jgi:hypothetical protein
MTKNAQRLSQLISTFGPGAMIDLPTRSVVVGGLEEWDMKGNAFTTIPEPRLTMRLEPVAVIAVACVVGFKTRSLRGTPCANATRAAAGQQEFETLVKR